jgi:serine phosphatase RsbU (regulator of sigma subunit)
VRAACEVVGMSTSMAIRTKTDLAAAERRLELEHIGGALLERVAGATSITDALIDDPALLLSVCDANGVAVRIGGALRRAGACPTESQIDRIQAALGELDPAAAFATDQLTTGRSALADTADLASGVLALNLSPDGRNAIYWFRRELVDTVDWAGKPQKVEVASDGVRSLGPRNSFASWSQIVRGRSTPWGAGEVAAATTLRSSLQSLLLERADQLALTVESDRRYDREHYIAETLKERLKPAPLPPTPGLDIAALYLPAGTGYGVSGDFFELIPAADAWFAVIGDVCGKGPQAASLTALARHTIRAVILEDPTVLPSRIMSLLNEAFIDQADGQFATVQIARLALEPHGNAHISLCSAGHPPALHRHRATITSRSSRSPLVGASSGLSFDDTEIVLEAGDALVMYTDGVTEAGRPGELFEQERLSHAVLEASGGSASVVASIKLAVRAYHVGELQDDIAVLCLQRQSNADER